jgi:hypothetical protein
MNVIAMKMTNGDELIGRLEAELKDCYEVSHLQHTMLQQGRDGQFGLAMMPYLVTNTDAKVQIHKSHVVCVFDPELEIEKNYLQRTSGIALG